MLGSRTKVKMARIERVCDVQARDLQRLSAMHRVRNGRRRIRRMYVWMATALKYGGAEIARVLPLQSFVK